MTQVDKVRLSLKKQNAPPVPIRTVLSSVLKTRLGTPDQAVLRRWYERFRPTLEWGRTFLPHHFIQPPSRMHQWLGAQLDGFQLARGLKLNVLGPRGHAKSTIATVCYVLRAAVEGWERYIWIVSDTKEQAQLHLANVKWELTDNLRLAEDYPLAVGQGPRWQRHAIELRSGVVIEAWGTGQRIRGRRRREHRPTLIVCDDLENDSHILSAAAREATHRWFHGTLLQAGTPQTNVANLATALHRDALAMQLDRSPGWNSRRFAAIESWPTNLELWRQWEAIYTQGPELRVQGSVDRAEPRTLNPEPSTNARDFYEAHRAEMLAGAVVLWPEVENLYTLMQMRVDSGRTAFDREKQSRPVDSEHCEFPVEYFDDDVIWFDRWPTDLAIRALALDPSKGKDAQRGDFSAFVMLGVDAAGVIYVEANMARRPTPQIVADAAAICREFQPMTFGVEANQFQELLADEIVTEFDRLQIAFVAPAAVHNYVNKTMRIRRIGPYLSRRRLRFLAGSEATKLLVDQLREFPLGAHDDGPDALEMALRLAEDFLHRQNTNDGLGKQLIQEP